MGAEKSSADRRYTPTRGNAGSNEVTVMVTFSSTLTDVLEMEMEASLEPAAAECGVMNNRLKLRIIVRRSIEIVRFMTTPLLSK
jgi:hypothetical protein